MIVPKGKNILVYLQEQNKSIIAPCNGNGICGKCKVKIVNNTQPNEIETKFLTPAELDQGIRLACTRVTKENTEVQMISNNQNMNIANMFQINYEPNSYLRIKHSIHGNMVYRGNEFLTSITEYKAYGVAIDIGTTTVVMVLTDLLSGEIIQINSFLNPQSTYGSDVISRIQYGLKENQLTKLSRVITKVIHSRLLRMLKLNGIAYEYLFEVTISANTTMVHLLLNESPKNLATAPFTSHLLDKRELPYYEVFGLNLNATVTIFGGFDAYVGGDILSGIYSENLHKNKCFSLLVDLGTNGEVSLVNNQNVYSTSVAAGPAFEGVNIFCGIGAVSGAVSTFHIQNGFETIDNASPIGICGSGLIDIVSELLTAGIIDKTGRMEKPYFITEEIKLIPEDVREVQLAKSAFRAGVQLLIEAANISFDEIDHVYIAGGFGKFVNLDNLYYLGLLPPCLKTKTKVIGNSSLSGALKYLLSPFSNEMEIIKSHSTVFNLGATKEFQDLFIDNIHFK